MMPSVTSREDTVHCSPEFSEHYNFLQAGPDNIQYWFKWHAMISAACYEISLLNDNATKGEQ